MHVVEPSMEPPGDRTGVTEDDAARTGPGGWAEQTRRVLTRDLLVRATYATPGEARALQFRALHLNLPLVAEVAGRLGLTGGWTSEAEHLAIDGLLDAVRAYDPFGEREFAEVAAFYVGDRLRLLDQV